MRRSLADRYHLVLFWDQRGNGLSERITESEYDRERIREGIATAFIPVLTMCLVCVIAAVATAGWGLYFVPFLLSALRLSGQRRS
jgi:hypothetical protein